MALATPLLVMFLLFAVFCGRLVSVQLDVDAAAHAAARAASLARTVPAAQADARRVAADTLGSRAACTAPTVDVDLDGLRPGGVVTVTVTCTVPLADLALLGIPGTRTVTSTARSPIDRYRGNTAVLTTPSGSSTSSREGGEHA